jgi:hypothetical protein
MSWENFVKKVMRLFYSEFLKLKRPCILVIFKTRLNNLFENPSKVLLTMIEV